MGKTMMWFALILSCLVPGGGLAAADPVQSSLHACQSTLQKETIKLIQGRQKAIAGCLNAVSKELIENGSGSVAGAASTCIAQLRKIYDSRALGKSLDEKFVTKTTAKCGPGQPDVLHTLNDLLGPGSTLPESMNISSLNQYCDLYAGGDAQIDTWSEFMTCHLVHTRRTADHQMAFAFPNGDAWWTQLLGHFAGLTSPENDPNKINDVEVATLNVQTGMQEVFFPGP